MASTTISKKKVADFAAKLKQDYGEEWCDDFDQLLKDELGIELPEPPWVEVTVRIRQDLLLNDKENTWREFQDEADKEKLQWVGNVLDSANSYYSSEGDQRRTQLVSVEVKKGGES